MKKLLIILPLIILGIACNQNGAGSSGEEGSLQTTVDSMSYAVGLDLVKQIKNGLSGAHDFTFNEGAFNTGIEEALESKDRFSKEQHQAFGMTVQMLANGVQMAKQAAPDTELKYVGTKEFALDTNSDSLCYSLGAETGNNLGKVFTGTANESFKTSYFKKGAEDAFSGSSKLSDEAVKTLMMQFQQIYQAEMAKITKIEGDKNLAEGDAYLAENATKDGVNTTDSGLQYKVIKKGNGKFPAATDKVKVHYEGKLLNGEIFDSSIQRGEPISFGLDGVIKGWTEGLQLMDVGSKYIFYIPGNLAYGPQGRPGIPSNATLIFDVELLGIE